MSKCIDCLHYEACKDTYYTAKGCDNIALYDFDGEMYADSGCEDFTDRSEWVHLPCKVGDKVYQTDGIRTYESTIREIEISSTNTVYCTENIAFDEGAIGNSIFLTRKEAEKALEGMK